MHVLIACEYSGIVRDAFIAAGHDAISCDLLPTERPGPHIQGDVRELLREPWDLVIAHPPCNYLTNYTWAFKNNLRREIGWWQRFHAGAGFFQECLDANAPLVAVENPAQMHIRALGIFGPPTQKTDFRHFAPGARKRVGLWLKGLPPLMANGFDPAAQSWVMDRPSRKIKAARGGDKPAFSGRETESHQRSAFQPGMAAAMARQWGSL